MADVRSGTTGTPGRRTSSTRRASTITTPAHKYGPTSELGECEADNCTSMARTACGECGAEVCLSHVEHGVHADSQG